MSSTTSAPPTRRSENRGVGHTGRPRRRRRPGHLSWTTGTLLVPFAVLFLLFFMLPIGYAIRESLLVSKSGGLGLGPPIISFGGLENFIAVFNNPDFIAGVGRVGLFAVINIPITIGLALFVALVLDSSSIPFRGFFRIVYFLPYAIPGVVGGILWAFLYSPRLSPFAQMFKALGAGDVSFLTPQLVIFAIANIVVWSFVGYNMLILTASLNALPTEQFEAARLDGAGRFREAIYIKLPQIVPAIVMCVLFAIIGTLQLFNEPLILSQITKSVTSTYTPNLMAYTEAFTNNNTNLAAAISVVLALITAVCSFIFLTAVRKRSAQ